MNRPLSLQERIRALRLKDDPEVQEALRKKSLSSGTVFDFLLEPTARAGKGFGAGELFSLRGAKIAAKNLPYSAVERGREFESVVSDPLGALGALGKVGLGGMRALAKNAPQSDPLAGILRRLVPEEYEETAGAAGRGVLESVTNPERIVEDPLGFISTLASVADPALSAMKLPRLAKVARVASDLPTEAVARPALGAARKLLGPTASRITSPIKSAAVGIEDFSSEALSDLLGVTTGAGGEKVRQAFKAGFEGNLYAFRKAIHDRVIDEDIAQKVKEPLTQLKTQLGSAKGKFVDDNARIMVPTKNLREEVFGANGILAKLNVEVTPRNNFLELNIPKQAAAVVGESKTFQQAIELIDSVAPHGVRFPEASLLALDQTKQALDALFRKGELSGVVTVRIRQAVSAELNQVPGYQQINESLAAFNEVLDEMKGKFGLRIPDPDFAERKHSVGRRLTASMNEGREAELRAIEKLEAITKVPLRALISGQGLSQLAPKGLIGRGGAAELFRGLVAGGAAATTVGAGMVNPALGAITGVGSLALFLPRIVGRIASVAGGAAKQIKQIQPPIKTLLQP